MPLTQTTLSFQAVLSAIEDDGFPPDIPPRCELSRCSSASSNTLGFVADADTIVVGGNMAANPLPTPSDSATDASSENGQVHNSKRRSWRHDIGISPRAQKSPGRLGSPPDLEHETTSRSISGKTLVVSTRQSSLLENSITALDLPWSMGTLFKDDSGAPILHGEDDARSRETMTVVKDNQEKNSQAAARSAKIEENVRRREAKEAAADAKASRRSLRTSIIARAGEAVFDLASSVLGKRPGGMIEKSSDTIGELKRRASLRPRSVVEPMRGTTPPSETSTIKRRRVSGNSIAELATEAAGLSMPRKPLPVRTAKRWLNSGLYTGQTRDFDGRLSERKNKRKQSTKDSSTVQENKVFPLPMFAGERLLKHGRDFKLPFDVFSPLPQGQPKPDEWRKTNKNVFVGDAAQFWRSSKLQEHSTCMCTPAGGCDTNCMNRFMFYECDEKNCNLTVEQCGNRSFEGLRQRVKKGGKYNVGVEVIKTADRGYGVRSNRTFEPNQIIVEYTGEIITQDECESRMRTLYKENQCYYLMLFDQNMIIDATRGSIARFVNHSCEPNCKMEKWTVAGKPRMALFAGDKGVMTGDELTYDYNFDPFSQKNVQSCRCGSARCRGVLGPKPKDDRKPRAEKEEPTSKLAGVKRKVAQILDDSTSRLNKKAKITTTLSKIGSPGRLSTAGALVKKSPFRSTSSSTRAAISRRPSKLKRIIEGAKDRAASKRFVSSSSAADALLLQSELPLNRRQSVKVKAASLRRSIARTVKGA